MEDLLTQRDSAEALLEALRAERSLETRPEAGAALDYEIGAVLEHRLGRGAEAIRHYLLAFNEATTFRPAFDALVSALERKRSLENLARLHRADLSSAVTRAEREDARLSLGSVEGSLERWEEAATLFREASDEDPSAPAPPAMLELAARRLADERLLTLALDRRAQSTRDPALEAALATDRAERGDLSLLEKVSRLASRLDPEGIAARALADAQLELGDHAARARALADAAEKFASAGHTLEAAILHAEAAAVQLEVLFSPRAGLAHAQSALALVDDPSLRLLAWEAARRAEDDRAMAALEADLGAAPSSSEVAEMHVEATLRSLRRGDPRAARAHASSAFESAPSPTTLLLLDAASARLGEHEARVDRLVRWARAHAEDASWALVLASDIAESALSDVPRASELAREAREAAAGSSEASARAFDLAKRAGDARALDDAAAALARAASTPTARAAALFERMSLRARHPSLPTDDSLLRDVLSLDAPWAAELVRVHAVRARRPAWIAEAHAALARATGDDAARAAHLSTAARFHLASGDVDAARTKVAAALAARPLHPYALALAAEIESRLGHRSSAEELRARRERARGARGDEPLEAALGREARGELAEAARMYLDRADDPLAMDGLRRLSPLLEGDLADRCRALLSSEGAPGAKVAAIELSLRGLGEARPDLDPNDLEMAWDVMLSERSARARVEASDALSAGDPKLVPLMKVARHLDGLASGLAFEPKSEGTLAHYVEYRNGEPEPRARALGALVAEPGGERRELSAFSVALLASRGGATEGDAFIAAQALVEEARDAYSALAIEETVSFADDPGQLGAALLDRASVTSEALSGSLEAAAARALAQSHAGADALAAARRAVADDPEDLASWDALRVAARDAGDFKRLTRACEVLADAAPRKWAGALLDEAGLAYAEELGDVASAEATFLRALRTAAPRGAALARLRELYRASDRDDDRLALLAEYAATARDDDPDLDSVLYELSGALRASGRLEEAATHVELLLSRTVDDPAALALSAEICVARGRWDDAVRSLRRLAVADVSPGQRRVARLAAADFLDKKLDRPEAALAELGELVEAGLADAKTLERLAKLHLRLGAAGDAARAYEHAARRLTGAEAARHFVTAGRLRAELGDADAASRLHRRALQLHPLELDAVVGLLELTVDPGEAKRLNERAGEILRASLPLGRCDVGLLRALHALASLRGDHARAAAILEALVALGAASQSELTRVTEVTTIVNPHGFSAEALVRSIAELSDGSPLLRIGEQFAPALLESLGVGLTPLGFSKHDRVTDASRSLVRDELNAIAARFGLGPFDLYRGGAAPRGLHLAPLKRGPAWLVGDEVKSPLPSTLRFSAAALAFGMLRGTLPFVVLDQASAEALLAKLAIAQGRPIEGLAPEPNASSVRLGDVDAALGFFGRRRAKGELFEALGPAQDAAQALASARREAQRAGLAVVVELHEALRAVLGGEVTPSRVDASADALALLSFWVRPEAAEFRALAGAKR